MGFFKRKSREYSKEDMVDWGLQWQAVLWLTASRANQVMPNDFSIVTQEEEEEKETQKDPQTPQCYDSVMTWKTQLSFAVSSADLGQMFANTPQALSWLSISCSRRASYWQMYSICQVMIKQLAKWTSTHSICLQASIVKTTVAALQLQRRKALRFFCMKIINQIHSLQSKCLFTHET